MKETYSVTALVSGCTLNGIVVEKKINGKLFRKKTIDRDEITQAAIEYCEQNELLK